MPPFFADFLHKLSDTNAGDLWEWIDGDPLVADNVIEEIANSHLELAQRITNQ